MNGVDDPPANPTSLGNVWIGETRPKLIESTTTETLPSGMTITTVHLTPEAKHGLSTNGARTPPPGGEPSQELTAYDHQQRMGKAQIALHAGTFVAIVLALLGVQPVACAMIPSMAVSIPTILWARRDLRAIRRRRLAREAKP